MNPQQRQLQQLTQLMQLKALDVQRLQREVALKRQEEERYQRNLARLDELCRGSGLAGKTVSALALNSAAYKNHLLQLKASQQLDLQLLAADRARSQQALLAANLRHEVLGDVAARTAAGIAHSAEKQAQKRTDEFAGLAWQRQQGRP